MLAGLRQTGERLDIARIARERGEEPLLCLGLSSARSSHR